MMDLSNYMTELLWILLADIGLIVAGFFAISGLFDKKWRERMREKDEQEERLLNLYKEEVVALRSKSDKQAVELKDLQITVAKISSENGLMKQILSQTDGDTKQFRQTAYDSMGRVKRMEAIIEKVEVLNLSLLENNRTLVSEIKELAKAINKSMVQVHKEVKG